MSESSIDMSNNSNNSEKSVRFGALDIHEYCMVLGDTRSRIPDSGAPLSIDVEPQAHYNYACVEEYEQEALPRRRSKDEFWKSPSQRTDLLLDLGYSLKQIERTSKAVEKVRSDRAESNKPKGWKRILPFKKKHRFGSLSA